MRQALSGSGEGTVRVLGIDPGSRITGFGLIEVSGNRVSYIESGCIRAEEGEFTVRLKTIFDGLCDVVGIYRPSEVAIEKIFMHRNADSALKLGQARGAAICAVMTRGLPVSEYTPSEVKQAMVGKGNAAKAQVQHMVQALLKLPGQPQADAADALAIAMCHVNTNKILGRIGAQGVRGGRLR